MNLPASLKTGPALIAAAIVVLAAAIVTAALLIAGSSDGAKPGSTPSVPTANGVARPDQTCVTTDGTDRREYWDGNGWWAGWIDGEIKEMPARSVMALQLQGRQVNSAWICAPR